MSMAEREINSPHDINEKDVRSVYNTYQFIEALGEYSKTKERHERVYEPERLYTLAEQVEMLWQQLAIIYAQTREEAIDVEELMSDIVNGYGDSNVQTSDND